MLVKSLLRTMILAFPCVFSKVMRNLLKISYDSFDFTTPTFLKASSAYGLDRAPNFD